MIHWALRYLEPLLNMLFLDRYIRSGNGAN